MASSASILKRFIDFRSSPEYQAYPDEVKNVIRSEVKQTMDYLQTKQGVKESQLGNELSFSDKFQNTIAPIAEPIQQAGIDLIEPIASPVLNALENPVNQEMLRTGATIAGGVIGAPMGGPVGSTAGALMAREAAGNALRFAGIDTGPKEYFPDKPEPSTAYKIAQATERTVTPLSSLAADLAAGPAPFIAQMGGRMATAAKENVDEGLPVQDALLKVAKENAPTAAALGLGPIASKVAKYLPTKALQTAVDYAVPTALSAMAGGEAGRLAGEVSGEMPESGIAEKGLEFARRGGLKSAVEAVLFPGLHMAGNRAKGPAENRMPELTPVEPAENVPPVEPIAPAPVVEAPNPAFKPAQKKNLDFMQSALSDYGVPAEKQIEVVRQITGRQDATLENLSKKEADAVGGNVRRDVMAGKKYQSPESQLPSLLAEARPVEPVPESLKVVDRRAAAGEPASVVKPVSPKMAYVRGVLGNKKNVALTSVQEVADRLRGQIPQEQAPVDRRATAQPEVVVEPTRPEAKPAIQDPSVAAEPPAVEPPSVQIVRNASILERYQKAKGKTDKATLQAEWDKLTPDSREAAMNHVKERNKAAEIWRKADKMMVEGKDTSGLFNELGALDPVAVNEARKLIPEPSKLDADIARMNRKETKEIPVDTKSETPVMDAVESLGRIKSKVAQGDKAGGEYDGQPKLPVDHQAKVLTSKNPEAFTSDQMARELQQKNGIGDGTTETMWKLIEQESAGRKSGKEQAKGLLESGARDAAWEKEQSQVVESTDLKVGEEFTVKGEKFKVIEENDSSLKLKDGVEIDVPYEGKDAKIRIDKGSLKEKPVETPKAELPKTEKPVWEMSKEEFDVEDAKGMGVSWRNAVKAKDGKVYTTKTLEHGDLISKMEEADISLDKNPRGWTWGKDKETFINTEDVDRAGGNFHEAYVEKALANGKKIPANVLEQYKDKIWAKIPLAREKMDKPVEAHPAEMLPVPAEKSMQSRPLYSVEYLVAKGLSKALKFGTNLLRQGVTDFVGWSKKMAATFGDKVKGQLVALWKAAKDGFMGKVEGRRGAVGQRKGITLQPGVSKAAIKKGGEIVEKAAVEKATAPLRERLTKKELEAQGYRKQIADIRKSGRSLNEKRKLLSDFVRDNVKGDSDFRRAFSAMKGIKNDVSFGKAARKVAEIVSVGNVTREKRQEIMQYKKAEKEAKAARLRPEIQEQVDAAMKGITSKSKPGMLSTVRAFIKSKLSSAFNDDFLDSMKQYEGKSIYDMPAAEIRKVRLAVQNMVHINKISGKLLLGKKLEDASTYADKAAKYVETKGKKAFLPIDGKPGQMSKGYLKSLFNEGVMSQEMIYDMLLGSPEIHNEIRRGENVASGLRNGFFDVITDTQKKLGLEDNQKFQDWNNEKITIPTTGRVTGKDYDAKFEKAPQKVEVSRNVFNHIVAMLGDNTGRRNIIKGNPITISDSPGAERIVLSRGDIDVIESMVDAKSRALIDSGKGYINGPLRAETEKTYLESEGMPMPKVEGYMPTVRDSSEYQTGANKVLNGYAQDALESTSSVQSRIANRKPIKLTGFLEALKRHVNSASDYAGLTIPVRNALLLSGDPSFKKSVRANLGEEFLPTLDNRLKALVERSKPSGEVITGLGEKAVNAVMRSPIAMSPSSYAKNVIGGLSNVFSEFSPSDYFAGLMADKTKAREEIMSNNYFRDRYQKGQDVLWEPTVKLSEKLKEEKNMALVQKGDLVSSLVAWEAAKAEVSRKNPNLKGQAFLDAVGERAEQAVSRTNNPSRVTDASSTILEGRGSFWGRQMMAYQSQGPKNIEVMYRLKNKYDKGEISGAEAVSKGLVALMGQIVNSKISAGALIGAVTGTAGALAGLGKTKKEKTEEKKQKKEAGASKVLKQAIKESVNLLQTQLENIPGWSAVTGPLSYAAESYLDGKPMRDVMPRTTPIVQTGIDVGTTGLMAVLAGVDAITGKKIMAGDNKGKGAWRQKVVDTINPASRAFASLTGNSQFVTKLLAGFAEIAAKESLGMNQSEKVQQIKKLLK